MALTKKNVVLPLIIAMALAGCGSDDDDTTASSDDIAALKTKLTGTWVSACIVETRSGMSHESYISTMVLDGSELTNSGIEYTDNGCVTQLDTWGPSVLPYVLGESTSTIVGGDGITYDVYPFDLSEPDGDYFTTVSLQNNDTELRLASEEEGGNDGSTAAKRAVDFIGVDALTKQ